MISRTRRASSSSDACSRFSGSAIAIQLLASVSVAQAPISQLKDEISTRIDALRPDLERIGRDIHANPEIAYEEHKAVGWLAELLKKQGFSVELGVANTETAFVASRRNGTGPTVAFLSEYDALRGLGHGCGHNLIATASAGAGIALADALDRLPGRVLVIGTPAEEGGGGKIRLIRAGIFQEVDAAMMFHPDTRTQVLHWALAVTHMHFEFIGRAAHASGDPEKGINALDAFVLAYNGISLLRQQVKEGARLHGFLKEGGTAPNIIPERTSGEFLVRARDEAYMQELVQKVKNIFQAAALATRRGRTLGRCRVHRYGQCEPRRARAASNHRHCVGRGSGSLASVSGSLRLASRLPGDGGRGESAGDDGSRPPRRPRAGRAGQGRVSAELKP
jgi:amidohydrolase